MSLCYDCQQPTGRPTSARRCFPCWEPHVMAHDHRGRGLSSLILSLAKQRGWMDSARAFSCVDCGKPAIEYEHRDYNHPLMVEPVCRRCNLRRGRAIPMDVPGFFARWEKAPETLGDSDGLTEYRRLKPSWFRVKR